MSLNLFSSKPCDASSNIEYRGIEREVVFQDKPPTICMVRTLNYKSIAAIAMNMILSQVIEVSVEFTDSNI